MVSAGARPIRGVLSKNTVSPSELASTIENASRKKSPADTDASLPTPPVAITQATRRPPATVVRSALMLTELKGGVGLRTMRLMTAHVSPDARAQSAPRPGPIDSIRRLYGVRPRLRRRVQNGRTDALRRLRASPVRAAGQRRAAHHHQPSPRAQRHQRSPALGADPGLAHRRRRPPDAGRAGDGRGAGF